MINQAMALAYRCPEELTRFELRNDLATVPGYFRFHNAICFGKCCGLSAATYIGSLEDKFSEVQVRDNAPLLPFDPNEVIENFELERYFNKSKSYAGTAVHSAYYFVRPLLPVWVRRHIQRIRLKGNLKLAFPEWPLDSTADDVLETLLTLALRAAGKVSTPYISFWPNRARSCAILTHDVETSTGLEYCSSLMDINDSFGMKSSFQLVPETRYKVTQSTIDDIRGRGFEVNVHDLNHDGQLYSNYGEFTRRVEQINRYAREFGAKGFRSGAMYRNLDWYDALRFDYDMSVPNTGHLEAQSGGCCTFRPYFINRLVELPLTTTQDYSLFHILGQYSIDLWKKQIERIISRRGLISFIVHPDYIIDKKAQQTYKQLLAYLAQLRDNGIIEIHLPGDIAQWWRERSQLKLENIDGDWKIAGPAKDKATISWASIDECGKLIHSEQ